MDAITLPVLPHDTPLHAALAVMTGSNVSGVLTTVGDDVRLVRAGDIYRGLHSRVATLGKATFTRVAAESPLQRTTRASRTWRVGGAAPGMTRAIGTTGIPMSPPPVLADYTLAHIDVGVGTVLTASEEYTYYLGNPPADCYCTGPRQHPYGRPHPSTCTQGDGASIECLP